MALGLYLINMSSDSKTVQIDMDVPAGWTNDFPAMSVTLGPGQEKAIPLFVQVDVNAPIGQLYTLQAQVSGLTDFPVAAVASVRVGPPDGKILIEAESAPRSQGPAPGSPMWTLDDGNCSGGREVTMFWADSWMEYDVQLEPGNYRLDLRATGSGTGDQEIDLSLDGGLLGAVFFPADETQTTRSVDFLIVSPGTHTFRVEYPVRLGRRVRRFPADRADPGFSDAVLLRFLRPGRPQQMGRSVERQKHG